MTEKDYEQGRKIFIVEGMISTTIATLSTGAFLAGYILYLGGTQEFSGLVLNVPMYSSIVQIFTPVLYEKLVSRKAIVALLAPLHRVLLGLMAFIPLLFNDTLTRVSVLFVLYIVSFSLLQTTNPAAINWIMSLVPDDIRGRYYGRRDSYMFSAAAFFSIVMGFVLDYFKKMNSGNGFLIMYSLVLGFAILNFYFLSKIKEPRVKIRYYKHAETGRKIPAGANLKQIFIVPFLDKKFRKVLLLVSLWTVSVMIAIAYFAIYQVSFLKLDYSFITFCIMLQTIAMVVFARIWGKFADKNSWFVTFRISLLLLSICHLLWCLMFKSVIYFIPVLYILAGISWSGINMSILNISFKYSPEKGKTIYLSVFSALMGFISLVASILGASFVKVIGSSILIVFGQPFTSMQFLFLFSSISILGVGIYTKIYFEKSELFKG